MGIDIADPDQLAPHLGTVVDVLTEALRRVPVQDVLPASTAAALELLLLGGDQLVLVRRLLREGVLVPAVPQ